MTTKDHVESIGSQLVRSAGPTLKSESAKTIAIANEKMIWPRVMTVLISPFSSVSCVATFAEMASARNPIASDFMRLEGGETYLAAKGMAVMKRHIVGLAAHANPSDLAQPSLDPHRAHVSLQ